MGDCSPFVRQAQKRVDGQLDDCELLDVDADGAVCIDEDSFGPEVLAALLRWAYAAGYGDGHSDAPPFTKNEASEPLATLPVG